ncbi:hypothetical protein GOP47_0016058 [Adiantum capillus-veneris]|uniref:Cupin-like domain-containing protein n=1 Tax=Adiantum capillus-veneris TaxID=13818 RepID=A0A9D4UJZ3_ADICA|nr:hypothetical protein GOP47_0015590 [Adiantum capillus-veneris]KAI5069757.1 hypothetical protein GOP47_0016058 [Adiantum capillus-veneris]
MFLHDMMRQDAETHLPWATEALGCLLEVENLWIRNEKAVTSFHKDHYENIYAVIAGEKHFTLLLPTCLDRLYIRHQHSQNRSYGERSLLCGSRSCTFSYLTNQEKRCVTWNSRIRTMSPLCKSGFDMHNARVWLCSNCWPFPVSWLGEEQVGMQIVESREFLWTVWSSEPLISSAATEAIRRLKGSGRSR